MKPQKNKYVLDMFPFASGNENFFCDLEKQKQWLPVDLYVGGSEHTTGHILYARFITKFLYDLGYSQVVEPFKKIINVGLMNASDGRKMSKSLGNVVTSDEVIEKWGGGRCFPFMSFFHSTF